LQNVQPSRALLGDVMTDALAPIATKLARCVRLLSSDKGGEIVAAAHAIKRTLKSAGADIHALAERIEKPNGSGLTEADMKKLYDAGFSAGVREAENRRYGSTEFHNVDGTPHWHEIALFCQQHNERLTVKEEPFVNDMAARTVWREPTEKQAKWLKSISSG
jgi:hypothetical protein